ncbi:hypothetical protein BDW02DRAFT_577570 [Decorospora gaudefroyi]|uniref:Uncharacterized protein n=1 Tax=Decorospora gaudefroyi TaxID=184978 RepID=A0A6A5KTM5_9PLEO|nr:hypothetical protein BDW02DRAFT_577570 [Decorospora gaudefroyi]
MTRRGSSREDFGVYPTSALQQRPALLLYVLLFRAPGYVCVLLHRLFAAGASVNGRAQCVSITSYGVHLEGYSTKPGATSSASVPKGRPTIASRDRVGEVKDCIFDGSGRVDMEDDDGGGARSACNLFFQWGSSARNQNFWTRGTRQELDGRADEVNPSHGLHQPDSSRNFNLYDDTTTTTACTQRSKIDDTPRAQHSSRALPPSVHQSFSQTDAFALATPYSGHHSPQILPQLQLASPRPLPHDSVTTIKTASKGTKATMAHLTYARTPMADLGGDHNQDRKLMHDTTSSIHRSDRPFSSPETTTGSLHDTEGRGGEQSATEGAADEDDDEDDEDSNTAKDNEQYDDETEVHVPALSYGYGKGGKGKGKRPGIRVEPAEGNDSHGEDETEPLLLASKHPVNQLLMSNKKRTFSNLSSTSVLFGDDSTDQESFPRRKMARKLSTAATIPLLTYQESDEAQVTYENAIESDDEDYSGVNLVPDDDESDIELMEQQEESFILQEEQQATTLLNEYRDARRLSLESCLSDKIFDVTAPLDETFLSNLPDFGFGSFFEPEALPDSPVPIATRKFSDGSAKRVRFDDDVQISDSSSSESSELDSSVFPDLFMDQDKIPPSLHQLLEMDNDDENGDMASPRSDGSFWDFEQNESRITQVDSDGESSSESSGYESDMGDTTDEEDFGVDILPQTPVQEQSVLRRPSSAPGSRAATPKPFQRSSRPIGRQIPPTRGVFIHSETDQAIAVTNRATKTVTFYRPRTNMVPWIPLTEYHSSTSSTANNSPRNSIAQLNASDSEVSNEVFNNGLSTDIMLTGIFGSAPSADSFGNQCIGPPEAFFPFVSVSSNGTMGIVDEDDIDTSDDDYEDNLNLADLVDFGSEGDDTDVDPGEDMEETDVAVTPATSSMALHGSTPAALRTGTPIGRKRSTSDVMLEHFDRGVVTAFRSNQNRYRDVASLPSDPAARASVSRPVRSGKSAEALITPLRKRSRSSRVGKSPLKHSTTMNQSSPLSGVTKAASRLQKSVMGSPRGAPRMGSFS